MYYFKNKLIMKFSKESMEVAIEFAKYLMQKDVTKFKAGKRFTIETYLPKEYDLMRASLIKDGEKLFKEFVNNSKVKK